MLFEDYRRYMFSIAYRMLGSAMEAEDVLQEVYLKTRDVPTETVQNPKAYFSTVVTRLCINHLNKAQTQREQYIGPWLPEPVITREPSNSPEAYAVERDNISMAFMVLLEHLNPAERAVFLLREVFDYSYSDIADMVGSSEVACRKTFSRAKQRLKAERPRFRATVEQHSELLHQFMKAVGEGNMNSLLALLVNDVVMLSDGGGKATAALYPLHGKDVVAQFLLGSLRFLPHEAEHHVQLVNGWPGIVFTDDHGTVFLVIQIQLGDNGRIEQVFAISNPYKIRYLTE